MIMFKPSNIFSVHHLQKDSPMKQMIITKSEEIYGNSDLVECGNPSDCEVSVTKAVDKKFERPPVPWTCQLKALIKRNFHAKKRVLLNPLTLASRILWCFIVGLAFYNVKSTEKEIDTLKTAVSVIQVLACLA